MQDIFKLVFKIRRGWTALRKEGLVYGRGRDCQVSSLTCPAIVSLPLMQLEVAPGFKQVRNLLSLSSRNLTVFKGIFLAWSPMTGPISTDTKEAEGDHDVVRCKGSSEADKESTAGKSTVMLVNTYTYYYIALTSSV